MLFKAFICLGSLQKTVFGGQPSKPDYKDIPCAVFWYQFIPFGT